NKVEIHIHNPQDKATSSTKPQQPWNIPYMRNDYFTGREEILTELHTRSKANNATALSQRHAMSGLGGIGKTQTAVEYAYRYHKEYQSVLWARAESHEALTSSYVEIAGLLNLPQKDEKDQTIIVQAVKRWLQENTEWLLILDNADEPAVVREFLPTKFDGHILLTTRAQALGGLARRIEIDTFMPEQGALLLLRRATLIEASGSIDDALQNDREVALQISEELGGLPLALDQAGAYIEEAACRLQDYQRIYQQHRTKLLKERRGLVDDHPEPVATTWALSFAKVEEKSPATAELLRLCAFLAPEDIAVEMIAQGAPHLGTVLEPVASDPYKLNQAIQVLRAYSLVQRDPSTGALSIHRLVQAVLRDTILAEEAKLWIERTVRAVNATFPEVEFAQWLICERYLPHAQACHGLMTQDQMTLSEVADLLTKMGWYLRKRGQYQEAEAPLQQALTFRERFFGSDHLDTAQSLSVLGWLYHAQGKYEQAEPLLVRVLAIYEQQLGAHHPDTATSLNNLALLYKKQGKYEQAEPLYVRALAISEQQLGAHHPDTANSLNHLAGLYYAQGKYEQAETLYLRALAIWEQSLGPQHSHTQTVRQNYAILLRAMGRDEEAKQLEEGNEC
ncbi:MAG TPA: tetratricopeptide repeat protein, partial [Ktedonobacteraceae bacterium]|nr:tetratricopeptide repeat protein [Ktedonobacteraceae bacterium]